MTPTEWLLSGLLRRPAIWLVVTLLVLASSTGAAVAMDLQRYRDHWSDRALPGAVANGIDLSGMTVAEATGAIERELAPRLDRPITLRAGERTWTTTPRELGATTDAASVAEAAVGAASRASWSTLAGVRYAGGHVPFRADATVVPSAPRARALVEAIAEELHVAPVDAELTHDGSRPMVTPEQPGRGVDVDATATRLEEAVERATLPGVGAVTVPIETVTLQPEETAAHYRRVLFLHQREHRLDLWVDGAIVRSYVVATGTGNYPTPTGIYHITKKRPRPTWVNPAPNGWGRGMPRRIGPGPNNPLGLRALNWDASGIRFHGTANVDSLGRDASHGCVRLSNDDIIELYDLVEVGDHIISVR